MDGITMRSRYLFRGKRVDNGEFIIGYYRVDRQGNHVIYPHAYSLHQNQKDFLVEAFYVDPATTGQCTGLLAAKSYRGESEVDRLIFEGDIVCCEVGISKKSGYVYWNPGQGRWEANTGNSEETWRSDFIFTDGNNWCGHLDHLKSQLVGDLQAHQSVEIIGNIHDNTED